MSDAKKSRKKAPVEESKEAVVESPWLDEQSGLSVIVEGVEIKIPRRVELTGPEAIERFVRLATDKGGKEE